VKPTVFIQANARQLMGARISAHSFKRNSATPDAFDVKILSTSDYPRLEQRGQSTLYGGKVRQWDPDDLQSFTPLRFAPPAETSYRGLALVTDPDVFAVGDVAELFARDLQGKAIWAVARPPQKERREYIATSVMLLDCAKLRHWQFDRYLDDLFAHRFDYFDWVDLKREDRSTIGLLEPEWNDFDRLTPETKILHTTKRRTQPWKTGLPIDYTMSGKGFFGALLRPRPQYYKAHPDPRQEALVYSLLADMVDRGDISRSEIVAEMAADHIRHDSLDLIDKYRGMNVLAA
jgi:hypothetical protein